MGMPIARLEMPRDRIAGQAVRNMVKTIEGYSSVAYPDPYSPRGVQARLKPHLRKANWEKLSGDPWTIGHGRAYGVKEGDTCTLQQADTWLDEDLEKCAQRVRDKVLVPVTQGMFDALVSQEYNLRGGIPRSVLACLNGGPTDKGVQMQPRSYQAAIEQFPRSCRAGGIPSRGLLRRRLIEACLASDLPWENACSPNIIRLAYDANGIIDWSESTTLEATLLLARQDITPPPSFLESVTKPWPEPKPEATQTIIVDSLPEPPQESLPPPTPQPAPEAPSSPVDSAGGAEDELILTPANRAAQEPRPDAGAPSPEALPSPPAAALPPNPPPQPESAKPSVRVVPPGEAGEAQPKLSASAPAAPPKPRDPAPPLAAQREGVDASQRQGVDWLSPKSMVLSRRFWGLFLIITGRVWLTWTGSNTILAAASDPIVSEMVTGVLFMGASMALTWTGECIRWWGEKRARRALR